jgi:hypothetical protein
MGDSAGAPSFPSRDGAPTRGSGCAGAVPAARAIIAVSMPLMRARIGTRAGEPGLARARLAALEAVPCKRKYASLPRTTRP